MLLKCYFSYLYYNPDLGEVTWTVFVHMCIRTSFRSEVFNSYNRMSSSKMQHYDIYIYVSWFLNLLAMKDDYLKLFQFISHGHFFYIKHLASLNFELNYRGVDLSFYFYYNWLMLDIVKVERFIDSCERVVKSLCVNCYLFLLISFLKNQFETNFILALFTCLCCFHSSWSLIALRCIFLDTLRC